MELQLETVLIALGAIVALVVLVKFGRAIGRFVLALAGIAAVVVVALALLTQGAATFQTAKAAQDAAQAVKVSSVGQAFALLVVGGLVVALTGALGVAGYCAMRWQIAERKRQDLAGRRSPHTRGLIPTSKVGKFAYLRRSPHTRGLTETPSPVVYIVQGPQAVGDLAPMGEGWGFDEVEQWTSDDWQF